MKKIAFVISILMVLTISGFSMAEEDLSFSIDDITVSKPADKKMEKFKISSMMSLPDGYQVTVDGNLNIVNNGKITFKIQVPENVVCLTQDWMESIESYYIWTDDYEKLANSLKEDNVHLLMFDKATGGYIYVETWGEDAFSRNIDNLFPLSERMCDKIGKLIAEKFGSKYTGTIITDTNKWMLFEGYYCMSIVNGIYVVMYYHNDDMLEDDLESFNTILSTLSAI